ncbi:hypothetical protein D3C84_1200310 [compost metagenome]
MLAAGFILLYQHMAGGICLDNPQAQCAGSNMSMARQSQGHIEQYPVKVFGKASLSAVP